MLNLYRLRRVFSVRAGLFAKTIERLETRSMFAVAIGDPSAVAPGSGGVCTCPSCQIYAQAVIDGGRPTLDSKATKADAGNRQKIDDGGVWPAGGENEFQVHPTNGRWTTNAAGSTGAVGNPTTLTWGFIADGVGIAPSGSIATESSATSSLQARLNTLYGSSAVWQPLFQQVFDRWSALSGLTFTYRGLSDDGAAFPSSGGNVNRADIRIGGHALDGGTGSNVLAYCYYPNTGDMVFDTDNFNSGSFYQSVVNNSRPLRNVIGHELGHGLGFAHVAPINSTKLMEASTSDNPIFDGPQFDDLLIAQRQYGDPFEKGGRNETPATASNLGMLNNSAGALVSQWVNANNPTNARSIANINDSDYLKFTISSAKNVSFTLSPFGPTYTQGPQAGPTASFNASASGNLGFTLFNTDGTSVLSNVNATAAGGVETVNASNLAPGTYFLRAFSSAGDVQPYNVSATISDAAVVPPAPSTPDLAAASDSGDSSSDNVTNDSTPTFSGTAEANSTISLRVDGLQVATALTSGAGAWTVTTPVMSDGTHAITAIASNGAGPGPASSSLSVTIDTAAPIASTPQFLRLTGQSVAVTFDGLVAGAGGLTLNNVTAPQSFVTTPTTISATNVEYVVSGNTLTDGKYTGTISFAGVADAAGNVATGATSVAFNFLRADFNEDDMVDFADLVVLAQNYNLPGQNHAQGNANYSGDGLVDFGDLVILAQTYNAFLPPLLIAAPLSVATGDAFATGKGKRKGDDQGLI